ncbi:MAG: FMN-binding glutamate synthase family protein [Pseudomonadales bacterium]|tara:strand:+ start:182 stop:1801 length:1620 start_codon:yes stop_codon:yes gene_type:complete
MTLMQKFFWFVAAIVYPISLFFSATLTGGVVVLVDFFSVFLTLYVLLGLYDLNFSPHTLNRLYPVAAYIRYGLEHIRTEIQQYFIAGETEELPFNREQRNLVYRRARNLDDTIPFGTIFDITEPGWLGAAHSMRPVDVLEDKRRVMVGGDDCLKPYNAARMNCSAMSFGSLSANAIIALNKAAAAESFYHNTGEGGFSPYHEQGGDVVWQIGTGYFGCRTPDGGFDSQAFKERAASDQVKMIEIKISQGAKPAHGGVLPAAKVTEEIARIRTVEIGKDVISPAAHSEFDTPKELLNFITRLRDLSGGKPVGFKLCIGSKSEFMAVCKAMLETGVLPDFITIDGAEGGTGAAPVEFSSRLGLPCIEGLDFVHNCLVGIGVRDKIRLIASGKTATGFDIVSKLAIGADIVNAARTMMLALGCIQSRACNTNNCPTGIATQDPNRGKALNVQQRHLRVANFQRRTLDSAFHLIGAMGLDDPEKLTPNMIWRRSANETNQYFDEIYPSLRAGELLSNEIHPDYVRHWQSATAESFVVSTVNVA